MAQEAVLILKRSKQSPPEAAPPRLPSVALVLRYISRVISRRHGITCVVLFACTKAALGQVVLPASTPIEIRLTARVSTRSSKTETPVHAILSAPVMLGNSIVLPLGSRAEGKVVHVTRVGLGIVHEKSSIAVQMERIILPDGTQVAFEAKVAQIEDSREVIDKRSRVSGVRSTSTLSHKVAGAMGALSFSNPIALIFTTAASASLLRFSDPEISLPANTELVLLTTEPISLRTTEQPATHALADSPPSRRELMSLVRRQPFRTETDRGHVPSDLTNLMFVGDGQALLRAFSAASWLQVDSLDAASTYRTIRSFSEQQAYRTAPMSTLLL